MPEPSAKRAQNRRRDTRRQQALYQTLTSLEPPFGSTSQREYRDLANWTSLCDGSSGQHSSIIDWSSMPSSCDPVCLLDNAQNTTRKKGVPIEQQISMLTFQADATAGQQGVVVPAVNTRGMQKRWQVESFAAVLHVLLHQPQQQPQQPMVVVDFGCGTGGLLLPLAHLFPHCHFIGVEMKAAAAAILQQRATAASLTNVSCELGMIEQFQQRFDVGLALHACGNATDHVMLLAQKHQAAFVVSPCCVGKLKFSMEGGSSFSPHIRTWHAVQGGLPRNTAAQPDSSMQAPAVGHSPSHLRSSGPEGSDTDALEVVAAPSGVGDVAGQTNGGDDVGLVLRHPRSAALLACLPEPEKTFKFMASLADTNFVGTSAEAVEAGEADVEAEQVSLETISKTCKVHVELDRREAAKEAGYLCALYRLFEAGATAKGDILVGLPAGRSQWAAAHPCLA